jgi:hypothetical protein
VTAIKKIQGNSAKKEEPPKGRQCNATTANKIDADAPVKVQPNCNKYKASCQLWEKSTPPQLLP